MQNRLSPKEVFEKILPYCPPTESGIDPIISLGPLFAGSDAENATPEKYFSEQSSEEQEKIKNNADWLRAHLLDTLKQKTYPSPEYTNIYEALLLLAYCFPANNVNEKNEIICPLSSQVLNEKNRFVSADGVWFLKSGENSITDKANKKEKLMNPITEKDLLIAHDIKRINTLVSSSLYGYRKAKNVENLKRVKEEAAFSLSPLIVNKQNNLVESKKEILLTGNGAAVGMGLGTLIGIAALAVSVLVPFSLASVIAVGLASCFVLLPLGAILGAVVEHAVVPRNGNKKLDSAVSVGSNQEAGAVNSSSTRKGSSAEVTYVLSLQDTYRIAIPLAYHVNQTDPRSPSQADKKQPGGLGVEESNVLNKAYGNRTGEPSGPGLFEPRTPSAPSLESLNNKKKSPASQSPGMDKKQ